MTPSARDAGCQEPFSPGRFRTSGEKVLKGSAAGSEAADIVNDAIKAKERNNILFGIGLHAYEDSWSHAGFEPVEGHGKQLGPDNPDYPYNDPVKAMDMAKAVSNKLGEYRDKHFPGNNPLKSFKDIDGVLGELMRFVGKEPQRAERWKRQIKKDFDLDVTYYPDRIKEVKMADYFWKIAQTVQEPKK